MSLIPMISMRDLVFFPGTTRPIIVGRPFTIASLKESLKSFQGQVVVTAQRAIEMNERPALSEMFQVGCLCTIVKHIEFPDGSMKLVLQAETKFKIEKINDVQDIRYCEGKAVVDVKEDFKVSTSLRSSLLEKIVANKKDWDKDIEHYIEKLTSTKEGYSFTMGLGDLLGLRPTVKKERTMDEIRQGVFVVDKLTDTEKKTINVNLARIQEILESTDVGSALKKIEALL